jgi:anti-anti-sigma regulatory factor
MDATGLVALESALAELHRRGSMTIITGLQPQPARVLANAHITDKPGVLLLRADLEAALAEVRGQAAAGVDAGTPTN